MAKIEVNGENQHPVYGHLKTISNTDPITWNFTKFFVDEQGNFIQSLTPREEPMTVDALIAERCA
eukprot:CAMPEP_0176356062 /NCGR_PEP_ID=MMETSP0126-20121128/13746_1 /TAXON_ID=141414 ORGANISM="Strombidinopsis acuminatum, Strain SPMC142" /NCGR_SAMPLE_ID=MMETSP0126 /ASSEMBLY_ACC=CAM_ASM_000229 /LENGTH=64 /DNA_ID=CAMNT_0017708991 /DNA_START=301 /DNA_END=495 /DNA_ORIENTATION=+